MFSATMFFACGSPGTPVEPTTLNTVAISQMGSDIQLSVPITMFILVDDIDTPDSRIASQREADEVREILSGMNEIWDQAGITLVESNIERIVVPAAVLIDVLLGDVARFFALQSGPFSVARSNSIVGVYVNGISTANGFAPQGSDSYFVADRPSVYDRRVSSHEVGHILGLQHTLVDPGRLMFSGTNGMKLAPDEIDVARKNARVLIDRLSR